MESREEQETSQIIEKDNDIQIKLEELISEYPDIFEKVATQSSLKISRKTHSGPVPDPETLKEYKQIYKSAPEIIFGMAKKEQSFRHISTYMGQISAFLIGIGGLVVTAYLGVNDQPWLAGIIGFGSLGSLVGVFLHQNTK